MGGFHSLRAQSVVPFLIGDLFPWTVRLVDICRKIWQWKMSLEAGGETHQPVSSFYGCRTNPFYSFYNSTKIKSGISFLPDLKSPLQAPSWVMCPNLNNPHYSALTAEWSRLPFHPLQISSSPNKCYQNCLYQRVAKLKKYEIVSNRHSFWIL